MFVLLTIDEIKNKRTHVNSLIERLADGDKDALGELYSEVSTDVYAFALSKTENVHDAEDATAETFVRIYKYAALYKPGNPMAWIFTIAMNVIKRERVLNSRHITLDEAIESETPAEGVTPAESLIKNDTVRMLLELLGDGEREIVIMHAISGLKHREIAKLLGMPLSTVLSTYSRAMKKLKIKLEGVSI